MPEKDRARPGSQRLEPMEVAGVPPGFEVYQLDPDGQRCCCVSRWVHPSSRTLVLKSSAKEMLLSAGIQDPLRVRAGPLVAGWLEGGRARHALVRVHGEAWVLKAYRRGGVVGRWNSERYWGAGRFFEELRIAALAERSGVATAEVLALIVEPAGLGSVRAWLVTRFLQDAKPLLAYFGAPAEHVIFRAAGKVVRQMHLANIDHHDLHLGNIMASFDGLLPVAHIVDWDRARLRARGEWNPFSNLSRLWRSVEKGRDRADLRVQSKAVLAFVRGYFEGYPAELKRARAHFRKRAVYLGLRKWFWRAGY